MRRIDEILIAANEARASDIHLSAEEPIRLRVDGDLVEYEPNPLSAQELQDLLPIA